MPSTVVREPTLVYDADCGFCTRAAKWLNAGGVNIAPWHTVDLDQHGLTIEMVTTRAYWVGAGSMRGGSDAIGAALIERGGFARLLGHITVNPIVRPVAHLVYGWIAKNRHKMPGATDACAIPRR